MDNLTRQLAEYAHRVSYHDPPPEVAQAAKRRILDTIGCALGGRDCDAAAMVRRLATGGAPDRYSGRVLGSRQRTTAEMAAFANTVMIRYLDFNDSHQASHPSDMQGALLALAEAVRANGRRLVSAIVVAYEVALRIVRATKLRENGWDQGYAIGVGTAAGVGHLLGLPVDRIAHAIAITAVANMPLRATRAGLLSHWKGAATAYAGRNAMFATLLAAEGMTSPDKPFEGRHGLWEQITGPFEIKPFADRGGKYVLLDTFLKYWPVEANTQAAIWAAIDLRARIAEDDIAAIDIGTYWTSWHETASEPEKWDPRTRETADHSMPYIFAKAFRDGVITVGSFDREHYLETSLRPLMAKIKVHLDDEVEAIYRSGQPNICMMRMEVTSRSGEKQSSEIVHPKGRVQNPMNEAEIGEKFRRLADPVLGAGKAVAAAEAWLTIDKIQNITRAMDLLEAE